MTERPLIAITTGGEKRLPRQPDLYLQALEGAGASAVFIGPDAGIMETAESYSGFLLPGGRDIDPLLYNEQSITDMDLEDRKRVDFDLALFHSAARQGKPILGICYGMQLINVATGGTLYQDIETQKKGYQSQSGEPSD
jgi:putative glutamine amidotransferase